MADDWLQAATQELDRLGERRHYGKMRETIIAIVGARLSGESEETVWSPRRPNVCTRALYYHKWKKDPLFSEVLANVERIARHHMESRALRARLAAAERLALASPIAVGVAIREMQHEEAAIRLRAAFGILDRAGVETATKTAVENTGPGAEIAVRVVDYRNGLAAVAPGSDEDSG